MVEVIHPKPVTGGLKHNKHFGQWHDLRTLHGDSANQNTDHKALREWARSKEHLPGFNEQAAAAKHQADAAHRQGMKMRNKEHEQSHWGSGKGNPNGDVK